MKRQRGNIALIVLVVVVVVALGLWWYMKYGGGLPQQTALNSGSAIQGTSDLDSAGQNLDNTNLNQMDSGINQVSADSSSF